MRLVPVVVVGLCVCLLASILGCKPAKRPSGKPDPWKSLRVEGRRGRVVKERSPRLDWEKMRAEPESITFVWASYEGPTLYGLVVVAGTGEAVYTYLGGSQQRRCTIPQDSLEALWKTIETSGFLRLDREYYAKKIVDGMALTIAVRGRGGQKLVYAYNYFPTPVRDVTTVVIEEILGTRTPPPVDLDRVLTPDYARWNSVPPPDPDNVRSLYYVLHWAQSKGQTPQDFLDRSPGFAKVGSAWFQLLWVETHNGQPRWVLDIIAGASGGAGGYLTYMDGEQPGVPAKPGAAEGPWKQVDFMVGEQACIELKRMLLSTAMDERGGAGQDTAKDAARVFVTLRTTTSDGELYFRDFSCDASKPEVARIAKFLREKVIAPHAEEMDQARTLSPTEAWTYLQLLKFVTP